MRCASGVSQVCSGVFRCSGVVFNVTDILEGQKGDLGGAAQKCAQFRVGGKFSTFWASPSAKKGLLKTEQSGLGPKLTIIPGGVKHGQL